MKVPCAISCGPTLMTAVGGESLQEGLDIHSDKTFRKHSTITMVSLWSRALINWLWKDTIGHKIVTS